MGPIDLYQQRMKTGTCEERKPWKNVLVKSAYKRENVLLLLIEVIDRKPTSFIMNNESKQEIKLCTFPYPVPVAARSKA